METVAESCQRPDCPGRDRLRSYVLGDLPEAQIDEVFDCARTCPQCQERLRELDDVADDVIHRLRNAVKATAPEGIGSDTPGLASFESTADFDALAETEGPKFQLMAEDNIPEQIGQYRVLEKIGAGGMGWVFKAEHVKLKRIVALKLLPPWSALDQQALTRFLREMQAAGSLEHQNLVYATDAGEDRGHHYLVMEYVEGIDLSKLLKRQAQIKVCDACEMARQAALGLDSAHHRQIVHRDVKPSNLMLSRAGIIKVLDLGLSRLLNASEDSAVSGLGQFVGTLDYIAPEQASLDQAVDLRADVYGLGCTLYALLAGSPPFALGEWKDPLQKIAAHLHSPPPALSEKAPGVPPELARIVQKMLSKSPEDRYADMAEVADALAPFCQGANLSAMLQPPISLTIPDENRTAPALESRPSRFAAQWKLAVFATACVALSWIVIQMQSANGTLFLEMDEAQFAAEFSGQSITIRDKISERTFTVELAENETATSLPPGQYLIVTDNQGLRFEPQEFLIARNKTHRLRIRPAAVPQASNTSEIVSPVSTSRIPPKFIKEWLDEKVIWDQPDFQRGFKEGVQYMQAPRGYAGRHAWNVMGHAEEGVYEVVARIGENYVGGWLINFTNVGVRNGLSVLINAKGQLSVWPSMFAKDSSTNLRRVSMTHPAIKRAGDFNRIQFVLRKRSLTIYAEGQPVGSDIECDFELTPSAISLGIAGGGGEGPTRIELKRFAAWPTTDINRIKPLP